MWPKGTRHRAPLSVATADVGNPRKHGAWDTSVCAEGTQGGLPGSVMFRSCPQSQTHLQNSNICLTPGHGPVTLCPETELFPVAVFL